MSLTTERPGKTSVMNVYKAKRTAIAIQRSVEKTAKTVVTGRKKSLKWGSGRTKKHLTKKGETPKTKGP
ncbi:hypothetical protein CHL67_05715 [Prosthecochloris sp. GSB1]|nr:hypothetical protein CHL67_05715 [Prosthecochloris sp. GSB1]